jgi:multidrug efflux pump subunit AcrA (membrane-fusion protein)
MSCRVILEKGWYNMQIWLNKTRIFSMRVLCVCLIIIILSSGCSNLLPKEEAALAVPLITPAAVDYLTYEVVLSDISDTLTLSGTLLAQKEQDLYFTYEQGRMKEMLVEAGDLVKEGDVLATIDTDDIDLQVSLQKIEVEKSQLYYDSTLEGSLERSIAALDLKKQKLIRDSLKAKLSGSEILAPFDGVVTYTNKTAIGELVEGYQTMVTIADPASIVIETDEAGTEKLSVGDFAQVTYDDVIFDVVVVETPATIDPESISPKSAFLSFADPIPEGAKIGAIVFIDYTTEKREDVIVISKRYVISANNRKYVNLLVGDIRVERDVVLGIANETDVEIVSGLMVGDLVITN